MSKVIPLRAHQDPATMLEAAKDWGMTEVLIIGYDADGHLVCGSTQERVSDCVMMVEQFKIYVMIELNPDA